MPEVAPPENLTIRNVRLPDGRAVDVSIADGVFKSFEPASRNGTAAASLDGAGRLMLPGLVEAHTHLDKTLWGMPWRPNSAGPRLIDYIENERSVRRTLNVPVGTRAAGLLEQMISLGSVYVRSHVDIDPEIGLSSVEALLTLREKVRGRCHLDLVAFPQFGMLTNPGTAALMEESLKLGVDAMGGIDPAGIDRDANRHLEFVFGAAVRHDKRIDIHLHDSGDLGVWQIGMIADLTEANGLKGRVMISHAYCLGTLEPGRLDSLAQRLADLGISILTSAPAEGSIPPAATLMAAGVNFCCGSDGVRDSWSPFGTGDMLERAMLLAYRFDWGRDSQLQAALDAASVNGAKAIGIETYGLKPGAPADFVLIEAETVGDAIMRRPLDRLVFHRGRSAAGAQEGAIHQ
jgi:cytosine deaminase